MIPFHDDVVLGPMPPNALAETGTNSSQKAFADHLAGETMGSGARKGFTYRWILNHLQDAHVRVVPRSLLNLIALSAKHALREGPKATGSQLLHPLELAGALEETSELRVAELQEEHVVVRRMEALRNAKVMMAQKEVIRLLDAGHGDGAAVFDELVNLGVLAIRPDTRVDVPDLYRHGYGVKRSGGVARPK
ncbi:MAG: hypothetical protein HYV07_10070 [Deltaproteobacteria bacterium]|nr:hypothetical protein [Deltaproteobacteria bacterium]